MVTGVHTRPTGPAGVARRSLSCLLMSGLLVGGGAVGLSSALAVEPAPPSRVDLGTAAQFSVLGGSTVTNTGPSLLNGDLGVSPGTSITGFPPGVTNGATHPNDAVAAQAESDTGIAYNALAGRASDSNLTGQDLAGLTLAPGVRTFDSSAGLNGTLTLDALGNPDAEFVFQIGSTLTTGSASKVLLVNGAQACHAFWQVGSSATLGTASDFTGSVVADQSISANTGASVQGRLLARNGAVTLDTNTISAPTCAPKISVTQTPTPDVRTAPGGSFGYDVVVTNHSDEPVTMTSLTDDAYGDLNGSGSCDTGGTMAPGASYTCAYVRDHWGSAGTAMTHRVTAVAQDAADRTATDSDDATVTLTPAGGPAPTGVLEICKRADNGAGRVTGTYTFTVAGRTVRVPVGTCTGPLTVPAGDVRVTEAATDGMRLSACNSWPVTGLRLCDPAQRAAIVHVKAGGVAQETILTITNRMKSNADYGSVKVCKVAGVGVAVGAPFAFTVGGRSVTVPAGPAVQGGYCKILNGFDRDKPVTVTEVARSGSRVSALSVQPQARKTTASLTGRYATVRLAATITVVTFTNSSTRT